MRSVSLSRGDLKHPGGWATIVVAPGLIEFDRFVPVVSQVPNSMDIDCKLVNFSAARFSFQVAPELSLRRS